MRLYLCKKEVKVVEDALEFLCECLFNLSEQEEKIARNVYERIQICKLLQKSERSEKK